MQRENGNGIKLLGKRDTSKEAKTNKTNEDRYSLKKNQNAPRHPPVRGVKISKRLGGIKGCKYKTSSWHLNGFPYGGNIGSTV